MRLEGRSRAANTAQESRTSTAYHAPSQNVRYNTFRPTDWCHATRDVASAPEIPAADVLPSRSVTMSLPFLSRTVLASPIPNAAPPRVAACSSRNAGAMSEEAS
jgi:hypothetical protein